MTIPNTLSSPSSSSHNTDNTNSFSPVSSPDSSGNTNGSGEAVNWLGQLGLNQRMGELRKTSTPTQGVWLNFGGRNHTDPEPPSFPATQISAIIAENIMRESKRLRTQLLHVSSPSSPSPSVTNGNEVVADSADDETDHHDDHDHDGDGAGDGRKKARSMVQAHLLLASAAASPKMEEVGAGDDYEGVLRGHQHVHASASASSSASASASTGGERFINIQNINRSLPVHNDNNVAYAYNPVVMGDNSSYSHENLVQLHPIRAQPISQVTFTADYPSAGNSDHLHHTNIDINNPAVAVADADADADGVKVNNVSDDEDDGRIHSLPYKKNGPYTCPRCNREFATSQFFASHVSASHYKYETQAQRKKRIMAKIRKRNLRLQKGSDGLTFVPVSSEPAGNRNAGFFAQPPAGPSFKVEVDGVATPGNHARANAYTGVKVKMEPDA